MPITEIEYRRALAKVPTVENQLNSLTLFVNGVKKTLPLLRHGQTSQRHQYLSLVLQQTMFSTIIYRENI